MMTDRENALNPSRSPMSRRTLFVGAAATAVCATAVCAARTFGGPDARLRVSGDLIWGVNGHPVTAYPGIPWERQFELLKELGFTHYRINLKDGGSPEELTRILKMADKYDVTILPILHPPVSLEKDSAESIYEAAFKCGRDVSRRFRGKVGIWELSNELENFAILQPCEMRDDGTQYPCEWGHAGGVGPLEYYGPRWKKVSAVLKGLSEGVALGDPKAVRAIGTAGWGHLGAFERMVTDKIAWDITVWHDYQQVTEEYLQKLASYGKPIWITEFNAGGGGEETPEVNARMLKERIAYYRAMREKYDVAAAFVYELFDETYWGDTFEARQGLIAIEQTSGNLWRAGALKPPGEAVKEVLRGK